MTIRRDNNVVNPNLGLYLGFSHAARPRRAMIDCLNVRIKQGRVQFDNMGWSPFPDDYFAFNLDGKPVLLIDLFEKRNGGASSIFANTTDLFTFSPATNLLSYITPRYETGTVDVTNGSPNVTGTGTTWSTNLKAGDFIFVGATGETDPAAAWYEVQSVGGDTALTLTTNYTGSTAAGESYTARRTFTGDITNPWVSEYFYNATDLTSGDTNGDRWYGCNTIDAVVAWDGEDDQAYYPDLGNLETCTYLRRHKNRMVYVGPTTDGEYKPYSIRTSDVGKPEDTVNGEAIELIVHDGEDRLLAAVPIGDLLALYSEKRITLAQYVGTPLIYAFRDAVRGYGPLSSRAIAAYPDYHDFLGSDLQYRFNGATAEPVNTHVWRDVLRRVTPERNGFIFCHFDEEIGELLWEVPLTTDADTEDGPCEQNFVCHYMEDVSERYPQPHTRRELGALCMGPYRRQETLTWAEITAEWQSYNYRWNDKFFFAQFPMTLFGDAQGNIYQLNGSTSKAGTPMDAYARFARVPVGSIENKGIVRRIYPHMEQASASGNSVTVTLYGALTIEGRASELSSLTFDIGVSTSRHFVSPRKSTRFVEVQLGTTGTLFYWANSGYALDTAPGGAR